MFGAEAHRSERIHWRRGLFSLVQQRMANRAIPFHCAARAGWRRHPTTLNLPGITSAATASPAAIGRARVLALLIAAGGPALIKGFSRLDDSKKESGAAAGCVRMSKKSAGQAAISIAMGAIGEAEQDVLDS